MLESKMIEKDKVFAICKKCGKQHNYGVSHRETGEFIFLDTCKECFVFGIYKPIPENIKLSLHTVQNRMKSLLSSPENIQDDK